MGIFDFFKKAPALPGSDRETPAPGEGRFVKLGIIVGHTKAAPGAKLAGTSQYEYHYNTEVAQIMAAEAKRRGNVIPVIITRDRGGISGAYREANKQQCDVVIELHFNAFNGKADGTVTLCTPDLTDVEFAHIVQNAMCRVFGRSGLSRGVKAIARSARGGGNVHAFPQGRNCLVEPFFGDNPREVALAQKLKVDYAHALVHAVIIWATKKDLIQG